MSDCRHVVLLGVNYASCKADVRDRLLFADSVLPDALNLLLQQPGILEGLILSTCNRVEIYAAVSDPAQARATLLNFLAQYHHCERDAFESLTYFYNCQEAISHLFLVAAAINSIVLGEGQILGQVKYSIQTAQELLATGPILNKLFQFAVTAGKRARSETKIGEGAVSVSLAAVELAKKILGKLEHHAAMVIGAGEMSELAAKHLRAGGIGRLYFANRSIERAQLLAEEFQGTPLRLDEKESVLHECDIVVSSTAAPHFVLTTDDIRAAMIKRKNRSMLLIDIAAPRDIHPDTGKLYNVFLYCIDDLNGITAFNKEQRALEVEKVKTILEQEKEKYFKWYAALRVQPTLVSLRGKFERIRDRELERYASSIAALPEPAQKLINEFAASLTNKFLHEPSTALKDLSSEPEMARYSDSLVRVFNLEKHP